MLTAESLSWFKDDEVSDLLDWCIRWLCVNVKGLVSCHKVTDSPDSVDRQVSRLLLVFCWQTVIVTSAEPHVSHEGLFLFSFFLFQVTQLISETSTSTVLYRLYQQ